jgi:hypothetical protein
LLQAEEAAHVTLQSEGVSVNDKTGKCLVEDNRNGKLNASAERGKVEDSLLKHSRALVLINCDYATAWSARSASYSIY